MRSFQCFSTHTHTRATVDTRVYGNNVSFDQVICSEGVKMKVRRKRRIKELLELAFGWAQGEGG